MKNVIKTNSTTAEVQQPSAMAEGNKPKENRLTMQDLKALQDKARQLLRPQHYGGYAGL